MNAVYKEVFELTANNNITFADPVYHSRRDITRILELYGNWMKYSEAGVSYSPIAAGFKGILPQSVSAERCTDDDALIIDSLFCRLKSINTEKAIDEFNVLWKYYINKMSTRAISKDMNIPETRIRTIKISGEGFIEGCLFMLNIKLECEE